MYHILIEKNHLIGENVPTYLICFVYAFIEPKYAPSWLLSTYILSRSFGLFQLNIS